MSSSEDEWIPEAFQYLRQRTPRTFKPRINFQNPTVTGNSERFRLTDDSVEHLVEVIAPFIRHETNRNHALTPEQQTKIALRVFANGSNLRDVGDCHGVHKSTVSRAIHRVMNAVNEHILPDAIKWPSSNPEIMEMIAKFRSFSNLAPCFGCIDGTHVNLQAPSKDEYQFVNRHGDHSINAAVVWGPDLEFLFVSARWPGSVSDSRIFKQSALKRKLDTGWTPFPHSFLLGDSGYANSPNLITPILRPTTPQEERFNVAHRQTRRLVECAIGLLKAKFRCLKTTLPFDPVTTGNIIRCCAVLHNLAITKEEAELAIADALNVPAHPGNQNLEAEMSEEEHEDLNFNPQGMHRRQQIVNLF